jgi:predicted DCC family thiol-disulfide oxidoreductase YuxK
LAIAGVEVARFASRGLPRRIIAVASLILYDGVCGLCNRFIGFILRRDAADRFRFASLQGALAGDLLRRHGRDARDLDTVCVLTSYGQPQEALHTRGQAVLIVLETLGGRWRLLARALRVVPRRLLDFGYDQIARRRYRWFGRHDACPLPAPGSREKFLDASA